MVIFNSYLLNFFGRSSVVSGGSVLFYWPAGSSSHHMNNVMPVAKEMARRGHEIVIVSKYSDKNPNPNITEIIIDDDGKLNDIFEKMSLDMLKEKGKTMIWPSNLFELIYQYEVPFIELVESEIAVSTFSNKVDNLPNVFQTPVNTTLDGMLLFHRFKIKL